MTTDAIWRFANASVIGTSHSHSGSPCQDFHACRLFTDAGGSRVVAIAVSDGAGSASRAEVGSELACTSVLKQLELYLAEGKRVENLTENTAREWIAAVQEVIANHAGEADCVVRDYACTLLFAVISDTAAMFLQIGDGAIIVSDDAGEWCWVFWPDRGEFANATYFITMDEVESRLQFEISNRRLDELAVLTDGLEPLVIHYASKTVHAPFFDCMFPPVRNSVGAGQDLKLSDDLSMYLNSPAINGRTDDDKTLVLASRRAVSIQPSVAVKPLDTAIEPDAQSN